MVNLSEKANEGIFWGNLFFELIYFILTLFFEDRFSNIMILPKIKDYPVYPYLANNLKERIIIMSNAHLIKMMIVFLIIIYYLKKFYVNFLFSKTEDVIIKNYFINWFSHFYLIILITIIDIIPYLFVYPYISQYTSFFCMPVLWNISQYILILNLFSYVYINNFNLRAFSNSIILSIISFIIQVLSFSNFYFTRDTQFTNYFNNVTSIIIFFFAPMLIFMKEYLLSYLFIKSHDELMIICIILTILSLEEIIYLILRINFVSPNNLFFGEFTMESIFIFLFTTVHDIVDTIFIIFGLNLATKGYIKSIVHLAWWCINIFGFYQAYKPIGYVLFTILTSVIDLLNYILIITLQNDADVFKEIYDVDLYTIHILINDNEKKNINLATIPQKDSSYNENENEDEDDSTINEKKINELKSEKASISNSNSNLESQIDSMKNSINDLKIEIGKLKIKNKKLNDEKGRLINELAQKEQLLNDLKEKKIK